MKDETLAEFEKTLDTLECDLHMLFNDLCVGEKTGEALHRKERVARALSSVVRLQRDLYLAKEK